jgi:hypothetical protein
MNQTHGQNRSLWIALSIFLIITFFELIAILLLNSGHFIFTLDDPYIHLALAENILNGHYGVNQNEFSAPSSSILWPFIIAPFAHLQFAAYAVLVMNIAAAIGTMILFWKLLLPAQVNHNDEKDSVEKTLTLAVILTISIPAVNLVGLIYTGMEHSVQLFLSTLIVYGLIYEIEYKKIPWWFVAAIVIAPLIRYECLALSLPSILFIYIRGYRAKSISAASLLVCLLGAFAIFLNSLGLESFPTSVIAKSAVVSSGGGATQILENFMRNLTSVRCILLIAGMLCLVYYALNNKLKKELRLLAFVISISAFMHLLVGRFGWYNRYEIYIWSSVILTLLYLNKIWIYQLPKKIGFYKMVRYMIYLSGIFCAPYFLQLITIPLASNNIYEQQYQMHIFATEYNKPVAVNDLGYVSYQNNNYVLDLAGMASIDTIRLIRSDDTSDWMTVATQNKDVDLVMIYDKWFKDDIPNDWKKLGKLCLGKRKITPGSSSVSFYSIGCKAYTDISQLIEKFSTTLPKGVVFEIAPNNCFNTDKLMLGS